MPRIGINSNKCISICMVCIIYVYMNKFPKKVRKGESGESKSV